MEGLCSPRPFMDTMPLVYRGDPLAEQLCASFDYVGTDLCDAGLLPGISGPKDRSRRHARLAAGWIGLTVSAHEEPARKRELISAGAALLPWRGSVRSVHEAVVAAFNRETEVIESGAATWSTTPDSKPGGKPVPSLRPRVTVDSADDIDPRSLDALVESVKPAHIPHRVEVVVRIPLPPRLGGDGAGDNGVDPPRRS